MAAKIYTVEIDGKTTRVKMGPETIIREEMSNYGDIDYHDYYTYLASEYDGHNHNYDGLRGAIIDRAVKKLWGKNAYWFGNTDQLDRGQVFTPGDSCSYSNTPTCVISVYHKSERIV